MHAPPSFSDDFAGSSRVLLYLFFLGLVLLWREEEKGLSVCPCGSFKSFKEIYLYCMHAVLNSFLCWDAVTSLKPHEFCKLYDLIFISIAAVLEVLEGGVHSEMGWTKARWVSRLHGQQIIVSICQIYYGVQKIWVLEYCMSSTFFSDLSTWVLHWIINTTLVFIIQCILISKYQNV